MYGRILKVHPNFNPINSKSVLPYRKLNVLEKLSNTLPESAIPNQTPVFLPVQTPIPQVNFPQEPVQNLQVAPHMPVKEYYYQHAESIDHMYSCIKCRHSFLKSLNFYERNKDLADIIPYIMLFTCLYLILKAHL